MKLHSTSLPSLLGAAPIWAYKDQLSSDEDTDAAPENYDMSDSGLGSGATGTDISSDRQGKAKKVMVVVLLLLGYIVLNFNH